MLTRHVPNLIAVFIALACIAGAYVQLAPLLAQPSDTASFSAPVNIASPAADTNSNRQPIEKFALFGDAQAPQQKEVIDEDLPETRLRLTLTGILEATDSKLASALIEGPDKTTESYKPGDTLPGNAKLERVLTNRVVIERSGRRENLLFPEITSSSFIAETETTDTSKTMTNEWVNNRNTLPLSNNGAFSENVNALPQISQQQKQNIKERLADIRKRMKQQSSGQ